MTEYIVQNSEFQNPLIEGRIDNPFYPDESTLKSRKVQLLHAWTGIGMLWLACLAGLRLLPAGFQVYVYSLIFFALCASATVALSFYYSGRSASLNSMEDPHVYHHRISIDEDSHPEILRVSFTFHPEEPVEDGMILSIPVPSIRKMKFNPYHNCLIVEGDFRAEGVSNEKREFRMVRKLVLPLNFNGSKEFMNHLEGISYVPLILEDRIRRSWILSPQKIPFLNETRQSAI